MNASSDAARTSRVEAADRHPEGGEGERREREREQPDGRTAPAEVQERDQHREHHRRRATRRTSPARPIFSGSSARTADQPAHQPAERVLLALEREHPGGEQQTDEHERDTTATSTPNTSSDEPEPSITCSSTRHGAADRGKDRLARRRGCRQRGGRSERPVAARRERSNPPAGRRSPPSMIFCVLRRPRMSTSPTSGNVSEPPATIRFR